MIFWTVGNNQTARQIVATIAIRTITGRKSGPFELGSVTIIAFDLKDNEPLNESCRSWVVPVNAGYSPEHVVSLMSHPVFKVALGTVKPLDWLVAFFNIYLERLFLLFYLR
jgi:hypothetical protein